MATTTSLRSRHCPAPRSRPRRNRTPIHAPVQTPSFTSYATYSSVGRAERARRAHHHALGVWVASPWQPVLGLVLRGAELVAVAVRTASHGAGAGCAPRRPCEAVR